MEAGLVLAVLEVHSDPTVPRAPVGGVQNSLQGLDLLPAPIHLQTSLFSLGYTGPTQSQNRGDLQGGLEDGESQMEVSSEGWVNWS